MQYNRKGTTVSKAIEDRKDMLKRWKELPPSARDHLTWEQFKRHEQFHQMAAGTLKTWVKAQPLTKEAE